MSIRHGFSLCHSEPLRRRIPESSSVKTLASSTLHRMATDAGDRRFPGDAVVRVQHPFCLSPKRSIQLSRGDLRHQRRRRLGEHLSHRQPRRLESIAIIKGPATGLDDPVSITLDSSGKIYVLNNGSGGNSASVEVFAPGSRGNTAPIARIIGTATRLLSVNRIAVDPAGQIYVAIEVVDIDSQPAGILIYPPGSNGNVAPSATIGGVESEIQNPWGIAIDLQGD